jgi:hypothetical protein
MHGAASAGSHGPRARRAHAGHARTRALENRFAGFGTCNTGTSGNRLSRSDTGTTSDRHTRQRRLRRVIHGARSGLRNDDTARLLRNLRRSRRFWSGWSLDLFPFGCCLRRCSRGWALWNRRCCWNRRSGCGRRSGSRGRWCGRRRRGRRSRMRRRFNDRSRGSVVLRQRARHGRNQTRRRGRRRGGTRRRCGGGGRGRLHSRRSRSSSGRTRRRGRRIRLLADGLQHIAGTRDLRQIDLGLDLGFGVRGASFPGAGSFLLAGKELAHTLGFIRLD